LNTAVIGPPTVIVSFVLHNNTTVVAIRHSTLPVSRFPNLPDLPHEDASGAMADDFDYHIANAASLAQDIGYQLADRDAGEG
jgi:hypothetical protein